MERFSVLICGGGIAAAEALLRLRRLTGDKLAITLLTPRPYLEYRPSAVLEPFTAQPPRRYPIERLATDTNAMWIRDTISWVDRAAGTVHSTGGTTLRYDALLLAVGASLRRASPFMDVFSSRNAGAAYGPILDDLDTGRVTELAFVEPGGPSWPLPLYELALMTAHRARERGRNVKLTFITSDPRPLNVFGSEASGAVERLLAGAGVEVLCSTTVEMPGEQRLVLMPARVERHPERTVTLHELTGPDVRGVPGDAMRRFLEVDLHCRVRGGDGVIFAAGDATNFPVKHGGVGAQQADTAAAGIAHLAGLGPKSEPLHPTLHGVLMTGEQPLYLSADIIAGQGCNSRIYWKPPQEQGEKVAAVELGAYLRDIQAADLADAQTQR